MIHKARNIMDRWLPNIAAVLFLISCLSTCIGVVDRGLQLNLKTVWAEEITRYTMIWAALLLIGIGMRKGTQTRLTILAERLPAKGRKALSVVILLLIILLFGILFYFGLRSAILNRVQVTAVLQISVFWPYMAIPVGSFFVLVECIMLIYEVIRKPKRAAQGQTREGEDTVW